MFEVEPTQLILFKLKNLFFAFITLSVVFISCSKNQNSSAPLGQAPVVKHTRTAKPTATQYLYLSLKDCASPPINCASDIIIHPKPSQFSALDDAISAGDSYVTVFFNDTANQRYFDSYFGTQNITDLANGDIQMRSLENDQQYSTYYKVGTKYNLDHDSVEYALPLFY